MRNGRKRGIYFDAGTGSGSFRFRLIQVHKHDSRSFYAKSARDCPADSLAAGVLMREEILQIAGRSDHRGIAVKEVVNQTQQPPVLFRDHGMNRLIGVEETRPGHLRDLGGYDAFVKKVIALP